MALDSGKNSASFRARQYSLKGENKCKDWRGGEYSYEGSSTCSKGPSGYYSYLVLHHVQNAQLAHILRKQHHLKNIKVVIIFQ